MHIARLEKGACTADVGALYLALASNVERVADHFINVADGLLPLVKSVERHSIKEIKHEVKDGFKSAEESAKVFGLAEANDTVADEENVQQLTENADDVEIAQTDNHD
jgi:phosphate uptake regulator